MAANWWSPRRRCCAQGSIFPPFRATKSRFGVSARCSSSERSRALQSFPILMPLRLASAPPLLGEQAGTEFARGSARRQQGLDLGGDSAVGRGDLRRPCAGGLAVGTDQGFLEIPSRRAGFAEGLNDPSIKR